MTAPILATATVPGTEVAITIVKRFHCLGNPLTIEVRKGSQVIRRLGAQDEVDARATANRQWTYERDAARTA